MKVGLNNMTLTSYENEPQSDVTNLTNELELWMQKVKLVYKSLRMRLNIHSWRFLVQQDFCRDQQTAPECQKKMVEFLLENHRLIKEIWDLLDESFYLTRDKVQLNEMFGKENMDIIYEQIEGRNVFPLRLFMGSEHSEFDEFIANYEKLVKLLDKKELESAFDMIIEMDSMKIKHPYFELCKAKYSMLRQNKEDSCLKIKELVDKYSKDIKVLEVAAEVYEACELRQRLCEIYKKIIEIVPNHLKANKFLHEIYLEERDYAKAKECCLQVLKINPNDAACLADLKLINTNLILEKKAKVTNNEAVYRNEHLFSEYLELVRCYLENKEYVVALGEMGKLDEKKIVFENPENENQMRLEYHSLLGLLYYSNGQYHQAIKVCEGFGKLLLEELSKLSKMELVNSRVKNYIYKNYETQAKCYEALGDVQKGNYHNLALESIIKAEEYASDLTACLLIKGTLLKKMKRFEEALVVCDRMIEYDKSSYLAYVLRQEIDFYLGNDDNVLKDYEKARELYPECVRCYELAMDIYLKRSEFDKALETYNLATEHQLQSRQLEVSYVRYQLLQVTNLEQIEHYKLKALNLYSELYRQVEYRKQAARILVELALAYHKVGLKTDALQVIQTAGDCSWDADLLWWEALLLYDKEEYQKALTDLLIYEGKYEERTDQDYYIAVCYRKSGEQKKAIQYYIKLYAKNPYHQEAVTELFQFYYYEFDGSRRQEDFETCLEFANKSIEIMETAKAFNDRASLYIMNNEYDLAYGDLQKASKLDSTSRAVRENLGFVYKCQGRYQDAIRILVETMRENDGNMTPAAYRNLAQCYHLVGEQDQALQLFQNYVVRYPYDAKGNIELIKEHCNMGNYHTAFEVLKEKIPAKSDSYLEWYSYICMLSEDYKKATAGYKKLLKSVENRPEFYKYMADCYLFGLRMPDKALYYYEEYYNRTPGNKKIYLDAMVSLSYCCRELGNMERIQNLVFEYNECLQDIYGGVEKYLQSKEDEPMRLYKLGAMYLYQGNQERAALYFNRISGESRCSNCSFAKCLIKEKANAQLLEANGELYNAVQGYLEVLQLDRNDLFARCKVKELAKRSSF